MRATAQQRKGADRTRKPANVHTYFQHSIARAPVRLYFLSFGHCVLLFGGSPRVVLLLLFL